MMQRPLLKTLLLAATVLLQSASATPADGHRLQVVKTSTNSNGQVIDWVVPESQGEIASPPPAPAPARKGKGKGKERRGSGESPRVEDLIGEDPQMDGPAGTVPILRSGGPAPPVKRLPGPADQNSSAGLAADAASFAGQHWYASSAQGVANHGGKATFSLYGTFVQSGSDFSLLQTAVVRGNAARAGTDPVTQTVEAGWITYPNQARRPHLFTYFTTNGYRADGNGVGGWNRDHDGWVQTDRVVYPGVAFSPLSRIGGAQYELDVGFLLYRGNWWLWVLDRWVGYYPGSLFSRGVAPADTLAGGSSMIHFYGEVYNSGPQLTTTDMGSGHFPDRGFGRAAYMHNAVYYDGSGRARHYDGSANIIVSDGNRYRIQPSFGSRGRWGSFMYLGGPGAGGIVGG